MRFIRFFFDEASYQIKGPDIRFGRYTDAIKTKEQYDAWEASLIAFEQKNYLETYCRFLDYLNDPDEESVVYELSDSLVRFSIRQGSALIEGWGDVEKMEAKVRIATADTYAIGLLRELLEINYSLQFCRYALDKQEIVLYFDTFAQDAYPYKLYQGLKELAVKADKLDDLIAWDYENLQLINQDLRIEIPSQHKSIKYYFVKSTIEQSLDFYERNPYMVNHNPGAMAYKLLSCCYKLDYLTKPEGILTDIFERVHKLFFTDSNQDLVSKNEKIYRELSTLLKLSPEKMKNEFYRVRSTFGIVQPVGHHKIKDLIASETTNMQWYIDNDMEPMVVAMTEYIVGYALFNYSVPPPIRDLFHFFFMVSEEVFFKELGYKTVFKSKSSYKTSEIRRHLRVLKKKHQDKYPNFNPSSSYLDFTSTISFCKSFLDLVYNMDLTIENYQYGIDKDS